VLTKADAAHGEQDHLFPFTLPGGRAVRHKWDGASSWAQFDLAVPNPPEGGVYQFGPGPKYWGGVAVDDLFAEAADYYASPSQLGLIRVRATPCIVIVVGQNVHASLAQCRSRQKQEQK